MTQPNRKEAHTRSRFALKQAELHYAKMKNVLPMGNILTCKHALKYLQARRIYVHYCNEYQLNAGLPLTK